MNSRGSSSSSRKRKTIGGLALDYDPFESSDAMKRLVKDVTLGVLSGQVYPKVGAVVKGMVAAWIKVDEHARLDKIEKRLKAIEVRSP